MRRYLSGLQELAEHASRDLQLVEDVLLGRLLRQRREALGIGLDVAVVVDVDCSFPAISGSAFPS